MDKYLQETNLLNFSNKRIQELVATRMWQDKEPFDKILEIYLFVRDEVLFGYNIDDNISASQVLQDGYGQCNTKGTLFMALLRSVGIPCRMHGFTIDKVLQKGIMTGLVYRLAPQNVVHSWVEVFYNDNWYNLEGIILDIAYIKSLQNKFSNSIGNFLGYGVATNDFQNPSIDWNKNDTYIQKQGINQDFGVFNSPDEFFVVHFQKMSTFKKFTYQNIGRHFMNFNVRRIRKK